MGKKIALSIEQMKHLEELGLDTSNASMMWKSNIWNSAQTNNEFKGYTNHELYTFDFEDYRNKSFLYGRNHAIIPAYTLQDIMRKITNWSNHLLISFVYFDEGVACILSTENDNVLYQTSSSVYNNEKDIDAAYQMLLWCIENNYIKTNKV